MDDKPMEGERLLKVEDVMQRMQVSRSVIYELMGSNRLRSISVGRSRRLRERDVDAFIVPGRGSDRSGAGDRNDHS